MNKEVWIARSLMLITRLLISILARQQHPNMAEMRREAQIMRREYNANLTNKSFAVGYPRDLYPDGIPDEDRGY